MAPSSYQTHYEVLEITNKAKLKEIRDAYRKLALKYHPDKDPRNPQAVAAFQKLSAAYETLSDENRRTKYDATLACSQSARQTPQPANWPPQRSSGPNAATGAWQEDMRKRAWDWSRSAQERADQARREDDAFWSGPAYAHGATDRSGWGNQSDREQKDRYGLYKQQQRQRAARKEAESKKHEMNTPPLRDPFDQDIDEAKAQAERDRRKPEAQKKAERERREDDGGWGKSPFPQQPEPDWSDRVEKEYQERIKKEKKQRADGKRMERKQFEKEWLAELPHLLSKVISIQADIHRTETKVNESKVATKDDREDEEHEQIFHLPIKRRSLQRRLNECLDEYNRILKWLRIQGREQEADEAHVKLREARTNVPKDKIAGRNTKSQSEQADSTAKTKMKVKAGKDRGKLSTNNESFYPDQNLNTLQTLEPSHPRGGKRNNADMPPKTTLPIYDGQNEEGTTPRMNYDGSDPDRGFTGDTSRASIAGDDDDYDDEDCDPPFCNAFHDSHMEVHREFWDIIDSYHECHFCLKVCTVMQCPKCDAQACAYCKDTRR